MTKPLLQLALDQLDTTSALQSVQMLAPHVDIIEAGTLLCCSAGMDAVRSIRARYPDHILVVDLKTADAGKEMAGIAFGAGANWTTVICAAPLATIEAAHKVAQAHNGEVQIELFGHWTLDQAREWRALGVRQAIYHRGRDAAAAGQTWSENDLNQLRALAEIGIEPSVTGGLKAEDLPLFKDIPVRAFIAGRALYGAADPVAAAKAFHAQIDSCWGK
jgi:3-dehydro-L-gulonate-6-phosphate decarboxylase